MKKQMFFTWKFIKYILASRALGSFSTKKESSQTEASENNAGHNLILKTLLNPVIVSDVVLIMFNMLTCNFCQVGPLHNIMKCKQPLGCLPVEPEQNSKTIDSFN